MCDSGVRASRSQEFPPSEDGRKPFSDTEDDDHHTECLIAPEPISPFDLSSDTDQRVDSKNREEKENRKEIAGETILNAYNQKAQQSKRIGEEYKPSGPFFWQTGSYLQQLQSKIMEYDEGASDSHTMRTREEGKPVPPIRVAMEMFSLEHYKHSFEVYEDILLWKYDEIEVGKQKYGGQGKRYFDRKESDFVPK